MITKVEQLLLKEVLSNAYMEDVLALLKTENIVKENGKPYEERYIQRVFEGKQHNVRIEQVFWQLVAIRKKTNDV